MTERFKSILEVPGNGVKLLAAVIGGKKTIVQDEKGVSYSFITTHQALNASSTTSKPKTK